LALELRPAEVTPNVVRDGEQRVAVCGSFTVNVRGDGEPAARLDLEAVPRE
jgi:hypothetical protein